MIAALRLAALAFVALTAAGCASSPGRTTGDDRFESFNRGVYRFNDSIDRAALKPVAKAYKNVTPRWMRAGIGNMLSNIEYPSTIVNQFLQGKGKLGMRDTGRFLLNTTLGVAGLFDVATAVGLEANDEDFGQTLAVWGVPSGPYVTLPFFGPSSVRDAPGRVVGWFTDALSYVDIPWEVRWGERALDVVHTRSELLLVDPTLERAYDKYAFMRDAWIQQREFQIFDGNPPPEQLEEDYGDEGETPADATPPESGTEETAPESNDQPPESSDEPPQESSEQPR
jgi:phospholipid-binding lipoprotein MlaA